MDEVIAVVNSKQKEADRAVVMEAERRRKKKDCKVIYQVSALAGLACLILASMWLPILAVPVSWGVFTAAVVVADRHIRRK